MLCLFTEKKLLNQLNLRTKLIGSFVIILLLMVFVGLVGVYTSRHIENHLEDIVEQNVKSANILGVVARRVGFIYSNSLLHLFTTSVEDMTRYESEISDWTGKINTDLNTLENMFKDQATLDRLAEFRADLDTYLRIWNEQVVPLSRANRDEESFALARKRGAAGMAAREAMYKINELHDTIIITANESLKLAEQDFRSSQYILLTITLLAIILGLAFGIKQSLLIAGPVNAVSKAAQLVAAGDLDQRVTVKTGDEIESMADSFNTMTGNMKKMVEELRHEITEHKRVQEALQESEQWLSTTLRSIGDAVIATDAKGLVTLMNPVAEDLTGWDKAETTGKPLEDVFNIINAQTGERADNPVTRVLREGVVVGLANDTLLIAKDGTKRPIADSGAPMRDDEGNIIGAVIVFRDITELKQAEEKLRKHRDHLEELVEERTQALRESEKKIRNLMESVPIGISVSTPEGDVLEVNAAGWKIFGYDSKEEFVNTPSEAHYYNPKDRERFVELHKKSLVKGLEMQFKHKDGSVFWGSVTSTVRSTEDGTTEFINTFQDITKRKQAEEILKESEHKYRQLAETAKDVIMVLDLKGNIKYINQEGINLSGYSKKEALKMNVKDVLSEDKISFSDENFVKRIAGDKNLFMYEVDFFNNKGDKIPVEIKSSLITKQGRPSGVLTIAWDITERKQAEKQLKKSLKEKEILIKEIYHRVKNNLAVVSGLLNMQSTYIKDKEAIAAFQETRDRIYSISAVHSQLYNSENYAAVDYKEYIKNLVTNIFYSSQISGLVKLHLELDDVTLPIDKAIPCGLLLNEIVTNAFKHAFPENRKGNLQIIMSSLEDKNCEIIVKDDGIGIPENFNLEKSKTYGLKLINLMTKQINGTLKIESKNGTEFRIRFSTEPGQVI